MKKKKNKVFRRWYLYICKECQSDRKTLLFWRKKARVCRKCQRIPVSKNQAKLF